MPQQQQQLQLTINHVHPNFEVELELELNLELENSEQGKGWLSELLKLQSYGRKPTRYLVTLHERKDINQHYRLHCSALPCCRLTLAAPKSLGKSQTR